MKSLQMEKHNSLIEGITLTASLSVLSIHTCSSTEILQLYLSQVKQYPPSSCKALGGLKSECGSSSFILFIDISCISLIYPMERVKLRYFKVRFIWRADFSLLKSLA